MVRQASAFDAFIFNVYFINIGIGVAFMLLFFALYPGANLVLSALACMVLVLPMSVLYVMFMSAMPRSGGDYVYVTRSLGPAWGFMSNWNWNMWNFYLMGIAGSFLGLYGISGFFRVIAGFTHNAGIAGTADFFTTSNGKFVTSAVLVIVLIAMFAYGQGLRFYFRFQKVTFALATLSTLIAVVAILIVGHDGFRTAFNSYVGTFTSKADPYNQVLQAANFTPAPFSFGESMWAVTWAFVVLGFGIASTYIGGEIKVTSGVFLKSLTGSVVYSAIWMAVILAVFLFVIGDKFLGSLSAVNPNTVGLAFTPTFAELGAMASGNIVIALVVAIGFAFWTYVWMPGYILSWSRSILAWSLDRLVPAKLGEVDPKRQAPMFGLGVLLVGSLIACALYSYTNYLTLLAGALGEELTFFMVAIAGIFFPYRQRQIWQSSRYNQVFAGVPVMTILAVVSLIGLTIIAWILITDPNSGVNWQLNRNNLIFTFATFISGLVIYYIAYFVQRSRGVDVTLAYREIPPE
ncbi:MAG TPA: amino acid permease [Candidatus Dormibacteraeota bacterium]|nr:amino acid permease [Candidatus Dormibacteraeota bacterium]